MAAQNADMAAENPKAVAENPGFATESPGVVAENPGVVNGETKNLEPARGSAEVDDLMEETATGEQPVYLYV